MEFDPQKNGWYFTKSVPFFPSIPLTEREVVGLFVAQKTIEQYKGTSLEPVLDGAFRKMTAGLDDAVKYSLGNLDEVVSIRPLASGNADMEKFQLFTRAVREKRVVRFVYRKHGNVATGVKVVHPHHVEKELEGSMGVFKGTEKQEVIIEFDAWGADDVRGRKWHAISSPKPENKDASNSLRPDGLQLAAEITMLALDCWAGGGGITLGK